MLKKYLKHLATAFVVVTVASMAPSCNSDENETSWKAYKDWRELNRNWLVDETTRTNPDGTAYYTTCVMPTDPEAFVLMHRIGDEHKENLQPLFTSATKVNYTLRLCNDTIVDRGAGFVSQLSSQGLITGWSLAVMQLHVGDSARFIIPYNIGYGTSGSTMVPPYSNLQFDIRLVDITAYEIKP